MDDLVAGRYQLVRTLGRGGMGEVALARQVDLDKLVVVKRADVRSQRNQRALVDEARIAARLNHPNIVSVLEVIDSGTESIVVMEFVAGVPLRELIEDAPHGLPHDVALTIAVDVLRGLAYAHSTRNGEAVGVIHRDVKPRNLMVTFAGVTKLIDFGISRWLGDDGGWEATSISGTRGYMAPEQQRGTRVDGRADQFAVGVTLREMLTGSPPVDDTGNASQPPRAIEPNLAAIVDRACADLPEDRFPSCADMISAIETFATGVALSASCVERWMSSRFADRKAFLDSDAGRRRARPPTTPTVMDGARGSSRTSIQARVAFVARGSGDPADAFLGPVIERLVRRHFRHAVERKFHVSASPGTGVQRVELAFVRNEGFQIEVIVGATPLGSVTGPSAWEATLAVQRLLFDLAEPRPTLALDPDEHREMQRVGAISWEAYRGYRAALEAFLEHAFPDSRAIADVMDSVLAADPEWAHAYALLVMLYGVTTPDAASTLATARARCQRSRDPNGWRMLDLFEMARANKIEGTLAPLEDMFRTCPEDALIAYPLLTNLVLCQQLDDATAVARRCQELHPDLGFSVDLADAFYRGGNERDAERVIRECVANRPEHVAATVELVRIEAGQLRTTEAARHAANLLAIHGPRRSISNEMFEALAASEQLFAAKQVAETMLLGTPLERARGRYRLAALAVFEGRFASATNSLRKAIDENRPFGMNSELTQCLELARATALAVNDVAGWRRLTSGLSEVYSTMIGDPAGAAAMDYELALLEPGDHDIDGRIATLEPAPRDQARSRMTRAAALAGRRPARDAVALGFTPNEDNTASLLALGICAHREGELELARRALEQAARLWTSTLSNQASPYHAVLAHHHLAGVYAELGDRARARAHHELFVRRWGAADRPIPEIAVSRRALAEP